MSECSDQFSSEQSQDDSEVHHSHEDHEHHEHNEEHESCEDQQTHEEDCSEDNSSSASIVGSSCSSSEEHQEKDRSFRETRGKEKGSGSQSECCQKKRPCHKKRCHHREKHHRHHERKEHHHERKERRFPKESKEWSSHSREREDHSRDREDRSRDREDRSRDWQWNQEWSDLSSRSGHPHSQSSCPQSSCPQKPSCCPEPIDCRVLRKYKACLDPQQEVNFVLSKAQGMFQATGQSAGLTYQLDVFSIDRVIRATLELGHPGQNGPIVVDLFRPVTSSGTLNGTISQGTINQSHLTGPLAGECLDSLITLMNQGLVYVNVYTEVYPLGEIRGQISSKRC